MRSSLPPFPLFLWCHFCFFISTARAPSPGDGMKTSHSVRSSVSERDADAAAAAAAYGPFWSPTADAACPSACFCESPDQATCVGSRVKVVPVKLNPYVRELEIVDASLVSVRTDAFKFFPRLRRLALVNCSVVKLEAFAFRGLVELETLEFSLNPLTHLPRYAFSGLFNVKLINLTHNGIKRVHSLAFESTSFVQRLLLLHNPLSHISARSFAGLSHVDALVISDVDAPTPIATLEPDAFFGLSHVKDLHLAGTPMTRLTPFSFRGLRNVGHMYLQRSKVVVVESHAFSGLNDVGYVHLDDCNIRHIQAAGFADMTNVSYVDLSKNRLYELTPESMEGVDAAVGHLDLMENPWHCNCSIHWMHKAANQLDDEDVTVLTRSMMSLRCHTPPEMRGRYLAQLDDRVMRCPTVAVERRAREGDAPVAASGVPKTTASGPGAVFFGALVILISGRTTGGFPSLRWETSSSPYSFTHWITYLFVYLFVSYHYVFIIETLCDIIRFSKESVLSFSIVCFGFLFFFALISRRKSDSPLLLLI